MKAIYYNDFAYQQYAKSYPMRELHHTVRLHNFMQSLAVGDL